MSNAVREWRDRLGLTQEQAARKLGITARNYQAYEHGDYPPTEPVRKLMRAIALGLDLEPWPIEAKQQRDKLAHIITIDTA